jgi:hypothetical protein
MTQAAAAPRPALISPLVDALCVGGLSLLLLLPLLLSGRADLVIVGVGVQAWTAALVNMPHFMASYRLIYRDRATIQAHRWAAIYVPLLLLAYIAFAVWQSRETDLYVSILMTVQGAYLAWHYTGQAWGMMATYVYLDGRSFQPLEKRLIRGGLYFLLAWHVVWFFRWGFAQTRFGPMLEALYFMLSILSAIALVSGIAGIVLMKRRTGRFPPAKALIAFAAIFVWYAAMARDPRAIFWVQIAHALQYLMFPVRVEINRTRRAPSGSSRLLTHMAAYLIVLLAVSVAMAVWIPARAMDVVATWLGDRPGQVTALCLLAFLNVHHYFTDGVMWKLRNPAVREDLFGHLASTRPAPAPAPAAPAPPPAAGARSRGKKRKTG